MTVPYLTAYIQGQGNTGADDLNTPTRGGAMLTDLQAFAGLQNMTVFMIGGSAVNDGNQGFFYWNSTWTGTPDNVNTIQPYGVIQGAWVRILTAPATINWSALPTTLPSTHGVVWNNNGVVSIS